MIFHFGNLFAYTIPLWFIVVVVENFQRTISETHVCLIDKLQLIGVCALLSLSLLLLSSLSLLLLLIVWQYANWRVKMNLMCVSCPKSETTTENQIPEFSFRLRQLRLVALFVTLRCLCGSRWLAHFVIDVKPAANLFWGKAFLSN